MTSDSSSNEPSPALVALSLIPGLGGKTIARLLDHFGSLDAVLCAGTDDLLAIERIGPKLAAAIRGIDLGRTGAQIAAWQGVGIAILQRGTVGYPASLAANEDAPPILFRRGMDGVDEGRCVAVVGTRQPTPDARQFAYSLSAALAERGWTVISGLAAGIDAAAHAGTIEGKGSTIAVLGCGVRVIYPPENARLTALILQHGSLLSEVNPDSPPNTPALVARNRLISGLSRAVIVVQAGATSGSMHAAHFARVQGRIVYAVQNGSEGNEALINSGARLIPAHFEDWDALIRDFERKS